MQKRRVALSFHWQFSYGWRVVEGVLEYARAHPKWEIVTPFFNVPVRHVLANRERIDGLLTDLNDREDLDALRALGKPTVECSNIVARHGFPRVGSSESAIGRMAAQFFLERHFSQFAFCGFEGQCYSRERSNGFRKKLAEVGVRRIDAFLGPFENAPASELMLEDLAGWLGGLRPPCAVFACNDLRALQLHQACVLAGLAVPEQISILGVDNEEPLMRLYGLALSSIEQDAGRIGWEAAAMLDAWMDPNRRSRPERLRLLPPVTAVARDSTPEHGPVDPLVAVAAAVLRNRMAEPIGIEALLRSIPLSRRSLERRFRKVTGLSPKAYLTRSRIDRARQLLRESGRPIGEVAEAVGYLEQRRFSEVFRKTVGCTPRDFRRAAAESMIET